MKRVRSCERGQGRTLDKLLYNVLEKVYSPINGEITVYSFFGSPRMTIGGLLQSGGLVVDIWKKAVSIISYQLSTINNILILGLGCGTAATLLAKRYPRAKIVGVEIDPIVIELGKKCFALDKIPNLETVCKDAIEYVNKFKIQNSKFKNEIKNLKIKKTDAKDTSEVARRDSSEVKERRSKNLRANFDLILVDLYLGTKIPPKTETVSFLKNLKRTLSQNGIIIFNRLFWDEHKASAEEFVQKAEKVFKNIKLARTVANLLVICS